MQVRDSVHSFDLEREGRDEPLSVHTVTNNGTTLLFGGGLESTAEQLVDIAHQQDVDVVVIEHGDLDHYEGVPYLQAELDIKVALPADDQPLLENTDIEPDYLLEGGEDYWGVETISAPGHTPGNMSFLYADVLIAGDTVVGVDAGAAADGEWSGPLAPVTAEYNTDDDDARKSVRNLLDYEYDTVLVTHGSNVEENGREAVQTLVDDLGV